MKPIIFATRLILMASIVTGCNTVKEATRLNNSNRASCGTPVVGRFASAQSWTLRSPAIVLKYNLARPLLGDSLLTVGDSLFFDASRKGPFFDPEPAMYAFRDLATVIGRGGKVLYGSIPRAFNDPWTLRLLIRRDSVGEYLKMTLAPGEDFAYCLESGTYYVLGFAFWTRSGASDVSQVMPYYRFTVMAAAVTNLGSWTIDEIPPEMPGSTVVTSRILNRPSDDFFFGVVGVVRQLAANEALHVIHVDNTWQPEGYAEAAVLTLVPIE